MSNKSQLIDIISKCSDRYGDKLLEFMEFYDLSNLNDASEEQLLEYIKMSVWANYELTRGDEE